MNRLVLSAATAVLMATPADAQLPVNFGIAAGPTFSTDAEQTGWHAGAFVGVDVPFIPVGGRVDATMNQWQFDASGADLRVWAVTANLIYGIAATPIVRPYVIGGLGFYSAKLDIEGAEAANDIGIAAGAGMRFRAGPLGFFAEARYHRVFNDADTDFIPVSLGLLF